MVGQADHNSNQTNNVPTVVNNKSYVNSIESKNHGYPPFLGGIGIERPSLYIPPYSDTLKFSNANIMPKFSKLEVIPKFSTYRIFGKIVTIKEPPRIFIDVGLPQDIEIDGVSVRLVDCAENFPFTERM